MPFTNDNPTNGAEQLRKWAWDVIEYRGGIELPEKLDREALEFLICHLDFLGKRFLYSLHFALCAIAKEEMEESEYKKFWIVLDDSIRRYTDFPGRFDRGLFPLIASGLQMEVKTVSWLLSPGLEIAWEIIRSVLPSRDIELVRAMDVWAVEQGECPGKVEKNYYLNPTTPEPRKPKSEPEWNPENVKTDWQRCRVYLNLVKRAHGNATDPGKIGLWLSKVGELLPNLAESGINDNRNIEIEKDFFIENRWACEGVDLEEFENRMLKRYADAKEDPEVESYEVEGIMGDLCEVWAATGNYEKLFEHIEQLDSKGSLRDVTGRLVEYWEPEQDIPRLLKLCEETAETFAADDDTPPYQIERMLCDITFELGKMQHYTLAKPLAEHLQNTYGEDLGFEHIATWYIWRGNYTAAREHGGGSPDSYRCPPELMKNFEPGTQDDPEAREYYKSVRNWEDLPKTLVALALHGCSREAVSHLIRLEIRTGTADWLHNTYYDDDPSYPRDYENLCQHAKEEAARSIRYKSGSGTRSPIEFRLCRLIILAICGVINLLIYRRWNGKPGQNDRKERKSEAKKRKCGVDVAKALTEAAKETDQVRRIRILKEATSRLHYVDGLFSDRYIEAPDLQEALRAEFDPLRACETKMQNHQAERLWESLSKALLEADDIPGAVEALQEREQYLSVNPLFSKQLVDKTEPKNWHLVARFCSTNPLSAAVLAEKLELWVKRARLP